MNLHSEEIMEIRGLFSKPSGASPVSGSSQAAQDQTRET
jgi:hypothetical protein